MGQTISKVIELILSMAIILESIKPVSLIKIICNNSNTEKYQTSIINKIYLQALLEDVYLPPFIKTLYNWH